MKLVLIAGGKGVRLGKLTKEIPKPMVKINNKPLLQHIIEWAKKQNITDIIITINHLGEKIENYFKDGKDFGVNIEYFKEKEPLGTGGALYYLKDKLQENFLALNADTFFTNFNTNELIQFHKNKNADVTIVVFDSDHPHDSDVLEYNKENKLINFHLRPHKEPPKSNKCIAGLYLLSPKIFQYITNSKFSLELELLPKFHKKTNNIYCFHTKEDLIDAGTPERLKKIEQLF